MVPLPGEKVQKDHSGETLLMLPTAIGSAPAALEGEAPDLIPIMRLVASIAANFAGEIGLSALGAWARSAGLTIAGSVLEGWM